MILRRGRCKLLLLKEMIEEKDGNRRQISGSP